MKLPLEIRWCTNYLSESLLSKLNFIILFVE